jgi:hypothetical protein
MKRFAVCLALLVASPLTAQQVVNGQQVIQGGGLAALPVEEVRPPARFKGAPRATVAVRSRPALP